MHIQRLRPPQKKLSEFPFGRLVLARRSPHEPTEEYRDLNIEIEITARVPDDANPKYLHHSERQTENKLLSQVLSGTYTSCQRREVLVWGATECIYQIMDSEVALTKALHCQETGVQNWLREKAQPRRKVYMIVGLWTLQDPRVEEKIASKSILRAVVVDPFSILCTAVGFGVLPGFTLRMIFSTESTTEKQSLATFQANGEGVWAVQYQRVPECVWSTRGTPSDKSETQWVVVIWCSRLVVCIPGLSKQRACEPFLGRRECPFKYTDKAGPIGHIFHSIPYTPAHWTCKVRRSQVTWDLQIPQLGRRRNR